MRISLIALFGVMIWGTQAEAGYLEIGTSYNYRQNYVDEFNRTIQRSITGSISYYFWEQSALELSYTDGASDIKLDTVDVNVKFEFYGLDLVISFAGRGATFRPYVKAGAVYQIKSTRTRYATIDRIVRTRGVSPSAGVGFRLKLTQSFVFRSGVDLWATDTDAEEAQYDMVGRAGISWLF